MRARRGFSLLEVMVAVAVLALLYTTLAEVSIHGLRRAGDSGRRFEASLLADQTLTEVENLFRLGGAPELGRDEIERGGFLVETEVAAYPTEALQRALSSARKADPREGPTEAELLRPPGRGVTPYLYGIRVRVSWLEAGFERAVQRTTMGFDGARAAARIVEARGGDDEEPDDADEAPEPLDS